MSPIPCGRLAQGPTEHALKILAETPEGQRYGRVPRIWTAIGSVGAPPDVPSTEPCYVLGCVAPHHNVRLRTLVVTKYRGGSHFEGGGTGERYIDAYDVPLCLRHRSRCTYGELGYTIYPAVFFAMKLENHGT